ncbi:hypothetical protein [Acinetobacter faecalis]|uniref:hypothetical protein n=1 Tax=Acinetobacter faecalis TaxID=2665161 RepID=UPI002A91C765|nr:hypothetical protein [Acinetobacter faecalis]MDY6458769.1 hypothetical protein [Acinetobacter faecalis]
MDKEKFRQALIATNDLEQFYEESLQGNDIWYFSDFLKVENPSRRYDQIKVMIATRLNLSVSEIAIVGSAKLGFSIAPTKQKMFRDFCGEHADEEKISDIDVSIVSAELFNRLWVAYYELKYSKGLPYKDYQFLSKNIFKKFLMINPEIRDHPILSDWFRQIEPCVKDLQTLHGIAHDVNYRVYESWSAMKKYHVAGLGSLKKCISGEG